jgi:hypothetical protein
MVMKSTIFWDITPCSPLRVDLRFGGTYRLDLQGRRISRARARNQRESRLQARLILRRWRWRRYVPPKRRLTFNRLHGVISQKILPFSYSFVTVGRPLWRGNRTVPSQTSWSAAHVRYIYSFTYIHYIRTVRPRQDYQSGSNTYIHNIYNFPSTCDNWYYFRCVHNTGYFGMAVKMSEITNAVNDQQPFEHLTWSKQFVHWFQLIVEWLFGWWKRKYCVVWFKIIRRVRRQFQERGSWLLLHDNARPHTAVSIKQFWGIQMAFVSPCFTNRSSISHLAYRISLFYFLCQASPCPMFRTSLFLWYYVTSACCMHNFVI